MLLTSMPEMIPTLYASRIGVNVSLSILDVACRSQEGMRQDDLGWDGIGWDGMG